MFTQKDQQTFDHFVAQQQLDEHQADQIKTYISLLISWNERFNLTTITSVPKILSHHFLDSILVRNYIDFSNINGVADVGSGPGFPGLPLKILYQDLRVYLIEVNNKKVSFLQEVIDQLGLKNVDIINLDWRTFLRKTSYTIDLFCSRASLDPTELIRMFSPACAYHDATLIYWASQEWQASQKEKQYIQRYEQYTIDTKQRVYVFFKSLHQDMTSMPEKPKG